MKLSRGGLVGTEPDGRHVDFSPAIHDRTKSLVLPEVLQFGIYDEQRGLGMSDDPFRNASHREMLTPTVYRHDDQIRADLVNGFENFPGRIPKMDMDMVEGTGGQLIAAEFFQFFSGTPQGKVMEMVHMLGVRFSPEVTVVCEIFRHEDEMDFGPVLVDE